MTLNKTNSIRRTADSIRFAIEREQNWISRARPGDRHIYHVGLLSQDRCDTIFTVERKLPDGSTEYIREIIPVEPFDSVARVYSEAATSGLVLLVQHHIAPATYEYIAVRTAKPQHKD